MGDNGVLVFRVDMINSIVGGLHSTHQLGVERFGQQMRRIGCGFVTGAGFLLRNAIQQWGDFVVG